MPYSDEGKALMLWNFASAASHLSLHSGPPESGHELAEGAYRRKQLEFTDPVAGTMRTLREITFDVPAGAHVTHAGFWSNQIGGALLASARTTEQSFRGRGVYVVDVAKLDLNCEV
jgi:hypothetical protein